MENIKTCCVTGHRPQGFPWNYADTQCSFHKQYKKFLTDKISNLISDGFTHFISGGAIGVDMDFAEAVLALRNSQFPNIHLEIAVPCQGQDLKWRTADKERYRTILEKANKVTILSEHYTRFCMQKRNEYMVNNSDLVLAFWNDETTGGTYNTISYAKRKNKTLDITHLLEFTKQKGLTALIKGFFK